MNKDMTKSRPVNGREKYVKTGQIEEDSRILSTTLVLYITARKNPHGELAVDDWV
jgi:hypothetical protein